MTVRSQEITISISYTILSKITAKIIFTHINSKVVQENFIRVAPDGFTLARLAKID